MVVVQNFERMDHQLTTNVVGYASLLLFRGHAIKEFLVLRWCICVLVFSILVGSAFKHN